MSEASQLLVRTETTETQVVVQKRSCLGCTTVGDSTVYWCFILVSIQTALRRRLSAQPTAPGAITLAVT